MPQAIGALIVGALGLTGTLAGTIIGGIISLGISLALQLLFAPKGPKPEDVKGTYRQSAAIRRKFRGQVLTGSNLAFLRGENGNLHHVDVFGQGPVHEYVEWRVDSTTVTLGDGRDEIPLPFWVQEEPYDGKTIYIEPRNGGTTPPTQLPFGTLMGRFPTRWSSAHRLYGLACAHVMQHSVKQEEFNKIYKSQITIVQTLAKWGIIHDPRTDSEVYSSNAALILADYLKDSDGARIPSTMIDWDDTFSHAADVSDEDVAVKGGGTIKRYHIGLAWTFDAEPKTVIDRILAAMDGRMYFNAEGKIALLAGEWVEPTVILGDEETLDFDYDDGAGPFAEANDITIKFTYPAARYSEATSESWLNQESIDLIGRRSAALPAYEIQHHNHARRIAKILAERAAPQLKGISRFNLGALRAFDQRWIKMWCTDMDIAEEDKIDVEVMSFELDIRDLSVIIGWQTFNKAAYDFDPNTEQGTDPPVSGEEGSQVIAPPVSVTNTLITERIANATGGGATYIVGMVNKPGPQTTGVSAAVVVIGVAATAPAIWEKAEIHSVVADSVIPAVFARSGDTFSIVVQGSPMLTAALGFSSHNPMLDVDIGQFIGYIPSLNGWANYLGVPIGTSQTPYYHGTAAPFDDPSLQTGHEIQVRNTLRPLAAGEIKSYTIRIESPPPDREDLHYVADFKKAGAPDTEWRTAPVAANSWFAITPHLEVTESYITRARFAGSGASASINVAGVPEVIEIPAS